MVSAARGSARALALWVNGMRVGEWRIARNGESELVYDPAWIESPQGRPLSLSLPYGLQGHTLKGPAVDTYFDNLLPDIQAMRQRLAARFQAASEQPFDLLAAIGRDCVGAVQLLPVDSDPPRIDTIAASTLSEAAIEQLLQSTSGPLTHQDDPARELRISIAGAQEKTALLRHRGRWCLPHGATPTTHILKLPLGLIGGLRADMRLSVENEWLCSRILAAYGVPVANTSMARFGGQKVLVVERFDRQKAPGGKFWLRLVQEDFCQATATPAARKYESEGGPGLVEMARILRNSEAREADLATLIQAQLLFWMLAATDGHAKNFSLRILEQGRYHLTPLYDVLSLHPILGDGPSRIPRQRARLAMALRGRNKHYLIKDIMRRHFNTTARLCGLDRGAEPIIAAVLEATPRVLATVEKELPGDFPERLFTTIARGVRGAAQALERMPAE